MLEHDFQSDIGYWIHMSAHRFECGMNADLAQEGITYRQCQVLGCLAIYGDLSQVELAKLANVEPPTIVKVLDRMERDGLINRVPCQQDRRRKLVRPTKKAVPIWKRIVRCAKKWNRQASQGLSTSEQNTLRKLLRKVHDNLSLPGCDSDGPRRAEST